LDAQAQYQSADGAMRVTAIGLNAARLQNGATPHQKQPPGWL